MSRGRTGCSCGYCLAESEVGATTAVFSIVYRVLWRALPFPQADRLVELSEEHQGAVSPLRDPLLSNLTYHAWHDTSPRTLDAMAAYLGGDYTVDLPGGAQRLRATAVTPSMFALIGATPARGRFFRAEERTKGADAPL